MTRNPYRTPRRFGGRGTLPKVLRLKDELPIENEENYRCRRIRLTLMEINEENPSN